MMVGSSSWQVILADLALILFMVTASALNDEEEAEAESASLAGNPVAFSQEAPASAIWHPGNVDQPLGLWLRQEGTDPRMQASLTIRYRLSDLDEALRQGSMLVQEARQAGHDLRIIAEPAQRTELFVIMAYDRAEALNARLTSQEIRADS